MRLLIIAGSRGAGKTSLCRHLFDAISTLGFDCAGCIETSRRGRSGLPHLVQLVDLKLGIEYLAARRPPDSEEPFLFFPEAFSRIRKSILKAYGQSSGSGLRAPGARRRLCIVDEVGPLELAQNGGHIELVATLLHAAFADCLILTVRPSLVLDLKAFISNHVPLHEIEILDIDRLSRERALCAAIDAASRP